MFTVAEQDNIKAITLKIGSQLTRKSYQGIQNLTQGHMLISSEYVGSKILECAAGFSSQAYDCCANSCVCFTGQFKELLICPLCNESRYDN